MTPADVEAVRGPRAANPPWAPDYPTEHDLEVAGFLVSGLFGFATAERPWGPWIIETEAGMAVGGCGFHAAPDGDGTAEIGYNVAPSHHGRGVATDAVRLLIHLARSSGATRLVAGTDPENVASQRVLENAEFSRTERTADELRWALDLPK